MALGRRSIKPTTFRDGQRVETPSGPGVVAYVRLCGPHYVSVAAVSVRLDADATSPGSTGTLFPPTKVRPLDGGPR